MLLSSLLPTINNRETVAHLLAKSSPFLILILLNAVVDSELG